jgi:hypothetical protein
MRIYNTNPSVNTLTKAIIAGGDVAKNAEKTAAGDKTDLSADNPVDLAVSERALSRSRRGGETFTRLQTAEEALQLTREVTQKMRSEPEQAAAAIRGEVARGEGQDAEAAKLETVRNAGYDLLKGVKIVNGMLITAADNIDSKNSVNDAASVKAMIDALRSKASDMIGAQANLLPQDVLSLLEID